MFANNPLMLNLDEKRRLLEILEAKDACIRDLETQLEANKDIASEIQIKLAHTQELLQNAESESEQMCKDQIDELNKHNEGLKSEIRRLNDENQNLKDKLQALSDQREKDRMESSFEITELQGRETILLNRLQEWSDKYNSQVDEIEKLKAVIQSKNADILKKEQLIQELREESEESREKNLDQLQVEQYNTQRLHQLVNEMRKKNDNLLVQAQRTEDLESKLQEQEEEMKKIIEQKDSLHEKLRSAKAYIQQLRQEMLTIKSESGRRLSVVEGEHAKAKCEYEDEIESIKREYEGFKVTSQQKIHNSDLEKSELQKQIGSLQKKLDDCVSALKTSKRELSIQQQQVKEMEEKARAEVDDLREEKVHILNKIRRLEAEKDQTIETYQKQINFLRSQVLKQSETEKKLSVAQSGLLSAKSERDDLLKIISEKDDKIADLKEKITNLSSRFKEERKLLKDQLNYYKNRIQEELQTAQVNAYNEVLQTVKESDEKNKRVFTEIQRKETLIKEYRTKINNLEATVEEITNNNTSLKSRIKDLQRKETSLKEIQATNTKLTEALKKFEENLALSNKTVEEKNATIKTLKLRIDRLTKDESSTLTKNLETIRQLEQELLVANRTIEEANIKIKMYRSKLERLLNDDSMQRLLTQVASEQVLRIRNLIQDLVQQEASIQKQMQQQQQREQEGGSREEDITLTLLGLTYNEYKDIMNCTESSRSTDSNYVQAKLGIFEQSAEKRYLEIQEALAQNEPSIIQESLENLITQRIDLEVQAKSLNVNNIEQVAS